MRKPSYPGITQTLNTCVLASIGGALNHLAGKQVWTEATLLAATRARGVSEVTFATVMPVAIPPVADMVEYKEHLDEDRKEPLPDFLRVLREHVDAGGLAIVSLEFAKREGSEPKRQGGWHMLTLITRTGNIYDVWDSNGYHTRVTEQELSCLQYPDGGSLFVEHDKHHALLLWRKPMA